MGEEHTCLADNEGRPALESGELVAALDATWQLIADALACWTAVDLGHRFPPPVSLSEDERGIYGERTREWIIWHVLEHDIHHGGELSVALGGYGLASIYDVQL
jgi:uncharacterized damage-inducible protein DinB